MARVGEKFLYWDASTASDVVGYRVYAADSSEILDYDTPYVDVGNVTMVNLGELANEGFAPLMDADGMFDLGISALDDMGNESHITVVENVPLDFVPPAAPTNPYVD